MKKLWQILLIQLLFTSQVNSQTFTVDDLLALTSVSSKAVDNQLKKSGFSSARYSVDFEFQKTIFYEKIQTKNGDSVTGRSIELYKNNGSKYFEFHTSSLEDYIDGQQRLVKAGFFHDEKIEMGDSVSKLFQKKNIVVEAIVGNTENGLHYIFLLEWKDFPGLASIRHADDLLKFNSHEYLAGFFGEKNVKKDLFFSDKELKKCTVLFGNSRRQAVFVWDDEDNLRNLSYILVSNIIPTVSAEKYNDVLGLNEWELGNGIYSGMSIKELLRLNKEDFEIYGSQSEKAFMIKQENTGKLDFKNTAVILSCNNCNDDRLLKNSAVKALDIAEENLPMYVYHIILFNKND